jgi:predicted Fe-Mo cluster-binding NifX family protein
VGPTGVGAVVISPRFRWVPERSRSLGAECCAWFREAGGQLFEWQESVIDGMLGLGEDDRFTSTDDGLNVARQNGKGVVLQAVEGFFAFELGYPVVMHTAHEFATSQVHQMRLVQLIQNAPHLHAKVRDRGGYMMANGKESINLKSGCSILFKARTKGGGRGYSGDLLVWDEAMVVSDQVVGAQKPMTRASKAPFGQKTIWAGSAVDQEVHEYGVNFTRLREAGIAESPRISWHEWSIPLDSPDQITEEMLADPVMRRMANPSMEDGLISDQTMDDELRIMPTRTAAVELFGAGDWPQTDGRDVSKISLEAWDAAEDPSSVLQEPIALAVDVSPERTTSIAAAGRNQHDKFHVEIQEHKQGTSWVVPRVLRMLERADIESIVIDGVGPAASLILALRDEGVEVLVVSTSEHGHACGRLVDLVEEDELAHLGSLELRDAVRGAKSRPLGDAWAWSRKTSSVDISPLVAATLALHSAIENDVGTVEVW